MLMCSVCGQDFMDSGSDKCSERCEQGSIAAAELTESLIKQPRSNDDRVFFYDMGFGDLCDRYTILVLRRLHQRSLQEQIETDFHIGRVRLSISTKINRLACGSNVREQIGKLIQKLYCVNAKMWRLRSRAMSTSLPNEHCDAAATAFFGFTPDRDAVRQELDLVVDGRARNPRVYTVKA